MTRIDAVDERPIRAGRLLSSRDAHGLHSIMFLAAFVMAL